MSTELTSEFNFKIHRMRGLMDTHGLDAVLLQRASSFAWMTCGASGYINIASSKAAASLLITSNQHYLVTTNIELPRLKEEEALADQGWEFCVEPWFQTGGSLSQLIGDLKVGTDLYYPQALDLADEIAHLRANLTFEEGERFRTLGQDCTQAIESAARSVRPGQTEYEIAALQAAEAERRGVQVTVNLIATDERIFRFRHPLPTHKKLDRYAMLVLCGRRQGLVCSVTRLVHFGRLPDDIRRKAEAAANVDAALINATRPGRILGEIIQEAGEMYARQGYPDEWRLHHQGGPAGYEPREYLARPTSTELIALGQVYAWNPSITGVKSEDTILIGDGGNEILTHSPEWPVISVEVKGALIERPAILEIT